jgi:hypothetical protein
MAALGSGYAGQLVGWATTQLKLTLQIVAELSGQTTFVVLHRRWAVERILSWINPSLLGPQSTAVIGDNLGLHGPRYG